MIGLTALTSDFESASSILVLILEKATSFRDGTVQGVCDHTLFRGTKHRLIVFRVRQTKGGAACLSGLKSGVLQRSLERYLQETGSKSDNLSFLAVWPREPCFLQKPASRPESDSSLVEARCCHSILVAATLILVGLTFHSLTCTGSFFGKCASD